MVHARPLPPPRIKSAVQRLPELPLLRQVLLTHGGKEDSVLNWIIIVCIFVSYGLWPQVVLNILSVKGLKAQRWSQQRGISTARLQQAPQVTRLATLWTAWSAKHDRNRVLFNMDCKSVLSA